MVRLAVPVLDGRKHRPSFNARMVALFPRLAVVLTTVTFGDGRSVPNGLVGRYPAVSRVGNAGRSERPSAMPAYVDTSEL